jgi:hypothetical protein
MAINIPTKPLAASNTPKIIVSLASRSLLEETSSWYVRLQVDMVMLPRKLWTACQVQVTMERRGISEDGCWNESGVSFRTKDVKPWLLMGELDGIADLLSWNRSWCTGNDPPLRTMPPSASEAVPLRYVAWNSQYGLWAHRCAGNTSAGRAADSAVLTFLQEQSHVRLEGTNP